MLWYQFFNFDTIMIQYLQNIAISINIANIDIEADWWKARAPTWNFCFRNSDKYSNVKFHESFSQWKIQWFSCRIFTCGVKKSWNFHWNFHWKFQWKFQWKFHNFLTPHIKVNIRQDDISKKYSRLDRYRYIEIFDISAGETIGLRYDISISNRYFDISKHHYALLLA